MCRVETETYLTPLRKVWKDLKVRKVLWELWEPWENRATQEQPGQQGLRARRDPRDLQQLNPQLMQLPLVHQDNQVRCRYNNKKTVKNTFLIFIPTNILVSTGPLKKYKELQLTCRAIIHILRTCSGGLGGFLKLLIVLLFCYSPWEQKSSLVNLYRPFA